MDKTGFIHCGILAWSVGGFPEIRIRSNSFFLFGAGKERGKTVKRWSLNQSNTACEVLVLGSLLAARPKKRFGFAGAKRQPKYGIVSSNGASSCVKTMTCFFIRIEEVAPARTVGLCTCFEWRGKGDRLLAHTGKAWGKKGGPERGVRGYRRSTPAAQTSRISCRGSFGKNPARSAAPGTPLLLP